ncbi:recombinase family protein [Yinghuangia sp. ASG 101]|uniref:recombinase family protein n=1 Tax=Yinghuangia sp. ASG 101 TaxID=2896848 RepID=UPI001E3CA3CB|nr:recombinase family protein [Yinghuangia sp. ASG 101]UGQ09744.1 recombinase family protein [Yinghuangia sp. ASG 101]
MDAEPDRASDGDSRHPLRDRPDAPLAGTRREARARSRRRGEPAAIYCRISHARDEDHTGVGRQELSCRRAAEKLGLLVDDALVFVDHSRSAWQRDGRRPGWDAFIRAVRDGRARHVLVYAPDRFFRQPHDLAELLDVAEAHDVTPHGRAGGRDLADAGDRSLLRGEIARACRSADDASRRARATTEERARKGRPHGGKRRYGYAADQRTVIEHEAAIVREIFTRYRDGATVRDLAKDLNARDERTAQGNIWNDYTVRAVLNNRHVAGIQVFRGEEIGDGDWPAIIGLDLWTEVQARRRSIRSAYADPTGSAPRRFYLLRGLVTCKSCGTHMGGSGGRYLCNRLQRLGGDLCGRAAGAATLDAFVTNAALDILETLAPDRPAAAPPVHDDAADRAADDDETRLAELRAMWDARELSTAEYRAMRKAVRARIDRAPARRTPRPSTDVLHGLTGPGARDAWALLRKEEDHARMNAVMRCLFDAVVIDAARTRGNRFDFGRVSITPARDWSA